MPANRKTSCLLIFVTALYALCRELKADGPERTNWPHYGKIVNKKDIHHCL